MPDEMVDSDSNEKASINPFDDNGEDDKPDYEPLNMKIICEDEYVDNSGPSSSDSNEKDESEGQIPSSEQDKEKEPDQADPIESNTEINSEQFDPNESESNEEKNEFNPNDLDETSEPEQFDPNTSEENSEEDKFDPNETECDDESLFDPNDYIEEIDSELNQPDAEKSEEEKSGEDFHENPNSQSTSTVLVSENIGETQELDHDQEELEREIEKELEEGVEAINKYLDEEAEFINAYQEMVGNARELDGERESEGEVRSKTEEEWEKEVETAAYTAEQLYESTNEMDSETESGEISEINEELEMEKEAVQNEEVSEPQLSEIKEELSEISEEELENEIEQHQVETAIEEALETEPEPMNNVKEIEELQELDLEEQFQTVQFNDYIGELVENQNEKNEQQKEEEVEGQSDNSERIIYEQEEDFENEIEQHQVEAAIEEALEIEPDPMTDSKEIEEIQELNLEEQFQTVQFNDYIGELVEAQNELKEEQEDEINEQNKEKIEQSNHLQKEIVIQEQELELEIEERDEVEQHQVEAAIEEELETEPEAVINEKKVEYVKNFEPEKQLDAEFLYELIEELAKKQNEENNEFEEKEKYEESSAEEKAAHIIRELEIVQEANSGETEAEISSKERELEEETTSQDVEEIEQFEIKEKKDHQQELEEILKQNAKIEQEALNEIELVEEESEKTAEKSYESAKNLYKRQTGKRPIYANQETKGFKQWLEQKKKSEEKEKTKQKKEIKEDQKKEVAWKWTLKNWIEQTTEIDPELKSELKKLIEKYNELEKIIKKYTQLYNKAKHIELSQAEKNELKSLIEKLHKLNSIKIELLLSIREIKHYLDKQYFYDFWDKERVNRIRSTFFKNLSYKYKIHLQRIEESTENEISYDFKVMIKKLIEDNSEYEKLEYNFMKLYKKYKKEEMTKKEKIEFKNNIGKLKKISPLNLKLYAEISGFKAYCKKQVDWDSTRIKYAQSNFIEKLSQNYVKLNEDKYFLKKYAKLTSECYRNEILEAYKELGIELKQLRFGGDFSFKRSDFEDLSEFESIVNSRGKYMWYGLVYKITEILSNNSKGNIIAGFTTNTMRTRWSQYVYNAIKRRGEGGKLHRLIFNYLNQFGSENLKVNEEYNWRKIFGLLNSRFKRTVEEIHFSSNSLRSGEIDYISEHNLVNSGLNIKAGGGGGKSIMRLPMISIAYYIAFGYMETEIHKKLEEQGIICSKTTVRRRINQFWGSFKKAQIKFLRPVFYLFLKNHFELHEINNAFNRFTLKFIETFFGGIPYKKLRILVDTEDIRNLPIMGELDGWEGITKLRIPASLLKQLIIQYLKQNEALKDPRVEKYLHVYKKSYYRYASQRQIYNQLGFFTWEEARNELVLPLIIEEIKFDESFSSIYNKYGWSKSTAHNHNRTSQRLFFRMDSSQVRQFLEDHYEIETYDDFKKEYLAEKG